MKQALMLALGLLLAAALQAQPQGYRIEVEVEHGAAPELYLAYHFGSKQYLKDTARAEAPGKYVFSGDSTLLSGVYLVVMPPQNRYFELLIDEDQHFAVLTDTARYGLDVQVEGSEENTLFYDYIGFLGAQRERAQALQAQLATAGEEGFDRIQGELEGVSKAVKDYQLQLAEQHRGKLVASLVRAGLDVEVPEAPEGAPENWRLYEYRKHYFDHIDWNDPRLLRTPMVERKIMDYLERLTLKHPDSVIAAADRILSLAYGGHEEVAQFVVSRLLNEYAASKVMGMDAVYVHLAMNYYGKGKTPWVDSEQLGKILDNAQRLQPLLIGKQAPPLTLPKLGGGQVRLYDVKAKYTVLYFWDPDCGNCNKATDKLVAMYDAYKAKGVEIFGVCNKTQDELGKCTEKEQDKGMRWINTADPDGRGQAHARYFVQANPLIFLLDEQKKIVYKRIDPDQLKEILDRLLAEGQAE
jgi:peroxiredoxin